MIERVVETIRAGHRFLLLTHRGPDGDGIGSMAGCAEVLRVLGKQPTMLLPEGVRDGLRHLAGVAEAPAALPQHARFDATLVFDCGDPALLEGDLPPHEVSGTVIVVDHHRVATEYGDLCWRDPDAAAVGEMVFRLASALGAQLTPAAAEALYVSIVSDTGSFRYANTSAEVLRIAAELVERGADPWRTTQALGEAQPAARVLLLSRVLATLKLSLDGRLATLEARPEMIEASGATPEMSDGFVGYARGIRGVEVGALLSVTRSGVRMSLRGRGTIDVARIAASFGGGGHHDAAGCELPGASLEEARAALESRVAEELGPA